MNSKTRIFLIAIFSCAFIVNVGIILCQQKTIKQFSGTSQFVEKMRVENILLKEGFFHTYQYEDTAIDYSVFLRNINDEFITLGDLLTDKNSLVLFMQVGSCRDCIYDNIVFIKNFKRTTINTIMGIDGLTEKEFKSFVRQYEIEDIAYLLPNKFFPEFDINPVVYFVVDVNIKSKYFYAPSIAYPDLTREYLNVIDNKLRKQK